MADKIIGNELFWLAAMAPPLLFFLCLLGNRAWQALKSIHHRLANRQPSRLALALGATIPLAFAAFIALQLLWAATDDYRTARCEREHQARLAKCFDEREDKKAKAKLELVNAQTKCDSKKKEDLAKCESAYNEALENCASTRDDAIRQAEEKARVERLKCAGDPSCLFLVDLALDMAINIANSEYTKCVENADGAKKECEDNTKAAHTRCMEDAQADHDLKFALADLAYDRCVKNSENQRDACLNPDDSSY